MTLAKAGGDQSPREVTGRDGKSYPAKKPMTDCHVGRLIELWLKAMTITGPQFRAARAMLGWTVRELARRSVVSIATINAIEDTNVPKRALRRGDLAAIQATLEEGGIEFTNGDEPGVKLKAEAEGKDEAMKGGGNDCGARFRISGVIQRCCNS